MGISCSKQKSADLEKEDIMEFKENNGGIRSRQDKYKVDDKVIFSLEFRKLKKELLISKL